MRLYQQSRDAEADSRIPPVGRLKIRALRIQWTLRQLDGLDTREIENELRSAINDHTPSHHLPGPVAVRARA